MLNPAGLATHRWGFAAFLLGVVGFLTFTLGTSSLLGNEALGRNKNELFESEIVPTEDTRLRFSAKFCLVTMLFVIFGVEALSLFAWLVPARENGWAGLIEATIFVTVLLTGLVYPWRIDALGWAPGSRRKRQAKPKQ